MKRLTAVILSVIFISSCVVSSSAVSAEGTVYYVDSVLGDNSNSGTDASSAWRTLDKIGTLTFLPGDSILFKRGGTYYGAVELHGNGTKELPITLGAYGDGAKPLLTTNERVEVLRMFDTSYWTVRDIEITAPNGGGIWIDALKGKVEGISILNIAFHGIQNYAVKGRDNMSGGAVGNRGAIMVKGLPARTRYPVNDLTISGCNFYDNGNGVMLWGSWNDTQTPWCADISEVDPIFNTGIVVEDCSFSDFDAEAVVVGMCDGAIVRNCSIINCCQGGADEKAGYYTAAAWFWGSVNSVIESCEIAGQKNYGDGMAVDFDSYTHRSTYQYIYSHDNTRFVCNCPFTYDGQWDNTIRYCLSVNDNVGKNSPGGSHIEHNLKFYNNTIINSSDFKIAGWDGVIFKNNIIVFKPGNMIYFSDNVSNLDMGNNCFYNGFMTKYDRYSFIANPQFAGDDYTNPESFILKSCSPCIGKGVKIEDNMGARDFFGNPLTSMHNIGCYEGVGVDGEKETLTLKESAERSFFILGKIIIVQISNLLKQATQWFGKVDNWLNEQFGH